MFINASVDFPTGSKLKIVEQYFPDDLAKNINELFLLPRDCWSAQTEFAHVPGRLAFTDTHATRDRIDDFARSQQAEISVVLGADVTYENHSLWLDLPGYRIDPHCDAPGNPWVAVQIYMGDPALTWEMLGFCIYTESRQALFEMHYRHNAGYICLYPDKIQHGLNHTIAPQFVRNSVYMRYKLA